MIALTGKETFLLEAVEESLHPVATLYLKSKKTYTQKARYIRHLSKAYDALLNGRDQAVEANKSFFKMSITASFPVPLPREPNEWLRRNRATGDAVICVIPDLRASGFVTKLCIPRKRTSEKKGDVVLLLVCRKVVYL